MQSLKEPDVDNLSKALYTWGQEFTKREYELLYTALNTFSATRLDLEEFKIYFKKRQKINSPY